MNVTGIQQDDVVEKYGGAGTLDFQHISGTVNNHELESIPYGGVSKENDTAANNYWQNWQGSDGGELKNLIDDSRDTFTYAGWFRSGSNSNWWQLLRVGSFDNTNPPGGAKFGYTQWAAQPKTYWTKYNNGTTYSAVDFNLEHPTYWALGEWHLAVFVAKGTEVDSYTYFPDGKQKVSTTTSNPWNIATGNRAVINLSPGTTTAGFGVGYQALWHRALKEDEVDRLAENGFGTYYDFKDPSVGYRRRLKAYFHMEEDGSATRVNEAAPDSLKDALVGALKFDAPTAAFVEPIQGLTWSSSGVTQETGKDGNAAGLTSASTSSIASPALDVNDDAEIYWARANSPFSFSFWLYNNAYGSGKTIISTTGGNGQDGFYVMDAGAQFSFYVKSGTTAYGPAQVAGTNATWEHWVCVYDPAQAGAELRVYKNGSTTPTTATAAAYTPPQYKLSATWEIGLGSGNTFNGKIDELLLHNRALQPEEIAYLGGGKYYPFTRGGAWDLLANNAPSSEAGKKDNAVRCTITGGAGSTPQYLEATPYTVDLQNEDRVMLSAWFYPTVDGPASQNTIVSLRQPGHAMTLYQATNNALQVYSNGNHQSATSNTMNINQWNHVIAWYDRTVGTNGTCWFQLNGGTIASSTWGAPWQLTGPATLAVGRPGNYAGLYCEGRVDEVHLAFIKPGALQRAALAAGKFYPFAA
jgi:hypothetical protein